MLSDLSNGDAAHVETNWAPTGLISDAFHTCVRSRVLKQKRGTSRISDFLCCSVVWGSLHCLLLILFAYILLLHHCIHPSSTQTSSYLCCGRLCCSIFTSNLNPPARSSVQHFAAFRSSPEVSFLYGSGQQAARLPSHLLWYSWLSSHFLSGPSSIHLPPASRQLSNNRIPASVTDSLPNCIHSLMTIWLKYYARVSPPVCSFLPNLILI